MCDLYCNKIFIRNIFKHCINTLYEKNLFFGGKKKMKIVDDVLYIIFMAIIVGILAINMISPHWVNLWVSIGAIIGVFLFMYGLLDDQKNEELDEIYSEYYALCEELKRLKVKKRKSTRPINRTN